MRPRIISIVGALLVIASVSFAADPPPKETRSAASAPVASDLKGLVERKDLVSLAAYYRSHPKDDRFRKLEGTIEAAPLIVMDLGGLETLYKLEDPTKKTFLKKRGAQVLITPVDHEGISQNVAIKDALRWKLVSATERTVEVSEPTMLNATKKSTQQQLEVQALAKRFKATIVLFTDSPGNDAIVKDMIVDIVNHGPAD